MRRLLFVLSLLFINGDALARVQLKQSYPAHNAHVMFREPEVDLEFSEPIIDPVITVVDFQNRVISIGQRLDGDSGVVVTIKSPVPPHPFPAGYYTVNWQVKSKATGEVSKDSFTYHVMQH